LADSFDPLSKLIIHNCSSCPNERDFSTYLWTEPETGVHVKGSQKIQLNIRVSANPGNVTRFPESTEKIDQEGSVILDPSVDVMIPIYWLDKYDVAADWQRDAAYAAQNLPSTFNKIFILCLVLGIIVLLGSIATVWWGLRLRKRARLSQSPLAGKGGIESQIGRESTHQSIAV
jgi:hypothetical protein